jgi:cytochrome b6-f complex iron-sulfur subunit
MYQNIHPAPVNNPAPGGGTSGSKITMDVTTPAFSALNTSGGSVVTQGIIVANTGGSYVALSSICTHLGCTIEYNALANNFPCPCHGSLYSTSGSVLNGPTVTALKSYPVSRTGDMVTITL